MCFEAHPEATRNHVRLGLLTEPPSVDAVGRPRQTPRGDCAGLLTSASDAVVRRPWRLPESASE